MKLAVMQPYIFPYIGYFQLVYSSDKFVFYDDVNFIKNGWITRNRIISGAGPVYINIIPDGASSFKKINEVGLSTKYDWKGKFLKSIENTYRRAPYFNEAFSVVAGVMEKDFSVVSEICCESVMAVSGYLGLERKFCLSSATYNNASLCREERLIDICNAEQAKTYINPEGGRELYQKQYFSDHGIELLFLAAGIKQYRQFRGDFIPGLSIIDVLMFNSRDEVLSSHLDCYNLS